MHYPIESGAVLIVLECDGRQCRTIQGTVGTQYRFSKGLHERRQPRRSGFHHLACDHIAVHDESPAPGEGPRDGGLPRTDSTG
ncbi:Uncharacterised protein [Mycobacteroides abscessus subsp. abscessus]|nr:Uncharacterised protein [Mycobacteroides abscessus subsp. abscessus]